MLSKCLGVQKENEVISTVFPALRVQDTDGGPFDTRLWLVHLTPLTEI